MPQVTELDYVLISNILEKHERKNNSQHSH